MKKLLYGIRLDKGFTNPYAVYTYFEGSRMDIDGNPFHVEHMEVFRTYEEAKDFILMDKLSR
jgi:hypothetical protein